MFPLASNNAHNVFAANLQSDEALIIKLAVYMHAIPAFRVAEILETLAKMVGPEEWN